MNRRAMPPGGAEAGGLARHTGTAKPPGMDPQRPRSLVAKMGCLAEAQNKRRRAGYWDATTDFRTKAADRASWSSCTPRSEFYPSCGRCVHDSKPFRFQRSCTNVVSTLCNSRTFSQSSPSSGTFPTAHPLRLENLERRCLLSAISGITEFAVPSVSINPGTIVTGPDGNIWFTESATDAIGMINPTTDAISSFTVPTAGCPSYWYHRGTEWQHLVHRA